MLGFRSTRAARRVALAAVLLTAARAPVAEAQFIITPTQAQATVTVAGLPGQFTSVWVSILSSSSNFGHTMYYFANPFNPNLPAGGGLLIPPPHPVNNKPWTAPQNETFLGTFAAGTELVFGIQLATPSHPFLFSGDLNRNIDQSFHLNNWGNGVVFQDDRLTPMPGTPNNLTTYGWEEEIAVSKPGHGGDYNDLLFVVRSETLVTPEPATLMLLGSGLVGLGGVIRRRRMA